MLSDVNRDLINAYSCIRDNYLVVEQILKRLHRIHSTKTYYKIRSWRFSDRFFRAAQFIYLNRTCWNGLYRVNLLGQFNVPKGTKHIVISEADDFESISNALVNVELICCDFEISIDAAGPGDLVFVDPPYTVRHNNNGFVKYNENIFSWRDQVRLRDAVVRAKSRGAKLIICNADHESVRELYQGIGAHERIGRHSVISGTASARGPTSELMISVT